MKTKDDTVKKIIDDLEEIKSALNDCDVSEVAVLTFIKKYGATKEYIKAVIDKDIEILKELDIWFKPSYHFDK